MSIEAVHCNGCGKRGTFFAHIKLSPSRIDCPTCHHGDRYHDHSLHFCDIGCLKAYFVHHDVLREGFPCGSCIDHETGKPSGFAHGFEANGPCDACRGTMRIGEQVRERRERTGVGGRS